MALLVPLGAGPLLYVWFWVMVPVGDPALAAADARPAVMSRLAPRLRAPGRRIPLTDIGVGVLLLLAAGLLVAMGGLGDRFGRRRMLLIGATGFAVVSVLAAFAPTAAALIAARAALGLFGR